MGAIEVRRTVDTPLDAVWETLTDFAGYGDWIPLTRMRTDPPPARVGWQFGGFTGVGPLGFLDSMLLVRWEPPAEGRARFSVRKTGRVLAGWADVRLSARSPEPGRIGLTGAPGATGGNGTDVVWREEIVPRPLVLGRLLAPVGDRLTGVLFARALDQMLAAAARRSPVSG